MAIKQMETKIDEYIKANIKAHLYLRGAACSMVMDHVEEVRSLLKGADGSEDELRNIIDLIK